MVDYARGVVGSWTYGPVKVSPLGTATAANVSIAPILRATGCQPAANCFSVWTLEGDATADPRQTVRMHTPARCSLRGTAHLSRLLAQAALRRRTLPLPDAAAGGTAVFDAGAGASGIGSRVLAANVLPLGSPSNATNWKVCPRTR